MIAQAQLGEAEVVLREDRRRQQQQLQERRSQAPSSGGGTTSRTSAGQLGPSSSSTAAARRHAGEQLRVLRGQRQGGAAAQAKAAQQIENGRFATDLLANDVQLAGFYGEFSTLPSAASFTASHAVSMSAASTRMPSVTNRSVMARPMPEAAPVTNFTSVLFSAF